MKYHVVVFFIVVVLAGCSPQRRLARLLERYPIQETSDTVYNTIIAYRDTVIFELIPGDTVCRDTIIPIQVDLPYTELKTRSTFAEATAWVLNNKLGLELIQYDTLFAFKLDSALVTNIDTVVITQVVPYPVVEKANPFWKNGFWVLAGVVLVIILLMLWFLSRKKVL